MKTLRLFGHILAVACVLVFAVAIWLGHSWWKTSRLSEETPFSRVTFACHGVKPMQADVTVVDAAGNPAAGANVHVGNNSGGNVATTDAAGEVHLDMSELEIDGITVDGKPVLSRPDAVLWKFPSVTAGFTARIALK